MISVLSGTNVFLRNLERNRLINAFTNEHGDLALEQLDAAEASYEQILAAIESLPFLATKKLVVISDLSLNKDASEKLDLLLERAGDTTDLIITETNPDKRTTYYKLLKKQAGFTEYNELDENGLVNWLVKEAEGRGAKLSRGDAGFLVGRVGLNQLKLSNELDKLLQFNPVITRQAISDLIDETPSSTIFNLIDAVFAGDLSRALAMYDDQRQQRVDPQAIHGMMVWQMHAVAIAVSAPKGTPAAQIAKDAGLSPFVVQKSQRIASKMGAVKVREFTKLLRDIDYKGKHQTFDYDEALRYAIVSLAH